MSIPSSIVFWVENSKIYLRLARHVVRFRKRVGYWPNVANPKSYNELIFWRKVYDEDPFFVICCDKIATKELFHQRCPGLKTPKLLWTGEDPYEIPEQYWQSKVAIKVNAASHWNVLLNGKPFDKQAAIDALKSWMSGPPFGTRYGENYYAKVPRKILVEELLVPPEGQELVDVKVYVCAGRAIHCLVSTPTPHLEHLGIDRVGGWIDTEGRRLPSRTRSYTRPEQQLPKDWTPPKAFREAITHAERLAFDRDFLRVDFLCTQDEAYGCELTIYPGAGYDVADPPTVLDMVTEKWDLRDSWFLKQSHRGWCRIYAESLLKSANSNKQIEGAG